MCCTQLAGNTGRKNDAKNRHLRIIAQAISSQLRHVSTIGQKIFKQQYLLHMPHNMVNFGPLAAEIDFVSLGHPCKFQRVSRLGSITARHSSSGRQPNCRVEHRRHLYSAGRPSRWALAHTFTKSSMLKFSVKSKTSNSELHTTEEITDHFNTKAAEGHLKWEDKNGAVPQ